jgi:hypothetical protein
MKSWIAPHLTGGLGNRLFQLAAAMGLAEKWNRTPVFFLPRSSPTNHGPFETIFHMFPAIAILETADQWEEFHEPKGHVFTYTPFAELPTTEKNIVVKGWRQSPLYFPSMPLQAHLAECIAPDRWDSLLKKYELDTKEGKEKTAFLHVRLGDYRSLPHHQVNLQHYYIHCLSKLPQGSKILFFSDEPDLIQDVMGQLVQALGHTFQSCNEKEELESLALMSQCWRGAITANSTFSWWGAYFAKQKTSQPDIFQAFFPSTWGQGLPAAKDVVPSWGERVQVD